MNDNLARNIVDACESTREYVKAQMERTGKSQAQLARETGYSGAAISQFLRGIYTGDNQQIAIALERAFDVEQRRQLVVKTPGFVHTSTTESIHIVLTHAHEYCDIGLVYGDAGLGKTMSLRKYAEETAGAILVTADVTISSSKAVLHEILDKLGKDGSGDRRALRKQVVTALRDSGRILMIDEAQNLQTKAIETLRSIHDECRIGIVLCGASELYAKLKRYPQLWSRVGIKRGLSRTEIKRDDIKMILAQDMEFPSECLNFFYSIATETPWGIRLATKLFVLSCKIASGMHSDLNMEAVNYAYDLTVK